jgi:hypothetical protein
LYFLTNNGEKSVAVDDPQCLAFFRKEYGFLLPEVKPQVERIDGGNVRLDPSIIELARSGNQTALGTLTKALAGTEKPTPADVEAARMFLRAEAVRGSNQPLRNGRSVDGGDNPWMPGAWNLTAQGKAVRELGEAAAAEMAARAGSKLGATRPAKVA